MSTDYDLQSEVEEARKRAFESVKKKLSTQSDLESLPSKKQAAIISHTDKLGKLKARVQTIVGGVDKGLNVLSDLEIELNELLKKLEDVKSNSKNVIAKMDYYSSARQLATVLDHLYTVDSLQKRFTESEAMMEDVKYFIEEHKDDISVNCFKVICQLIDFEQELLKQTKQSINIQFLKEKFAPALNARLQIISNAERIIMSAFNDQEKNITTDLLSRAIWIIITDAVRKNESGIDNVKSLLTNSISQQFQNASAESLEQIDALLKKLQGVLDSLTDKLDIIIPALPSEENGHQGIDIMEIITKMANEEVLKILDRLVGNNRTSFLLSRVIIWLRDYMSSMSHMLGVSPSDDMKLKLKYFTNSLVNQIPNDMEVFLQNIIGMEDSAIEKSRDGNLSTPCPYDFQKRLIESHEIAKQTDLPELLPEIDENLIERFIQKTGEICEVVQNSYNSEYVVACTNNTLNGVRIASGLPSQLPGIIKTENVNALKSEWGKIQKAGIARLIDLTIANACEASNWDLRPDFTTKFEGVVEAINKIKVEMVGPLFRKFINQFAHQFVAYYFLAYKQPYKGQKLTDDEVISAVQNDTEAMIAWVEQIGGTSAAWVKPLQSALTGFQRLIIEDNQYIISNVGPLFACYSDFKPEIVIKICKNKPNGKEPDANLQTLYDEAVTKPESSGYITNILDKFKGK